MKIDQQRRQRPIGLDGVTLTNADRDRARKLAGILYNLPVEYCATIRWALGRSILLLEEEAPMWTEGSNTEPYSREGERLEELTRSFLLLQALVHAESHPRPRDEI